MYFVWFTGERNRLSIESGALKHGLVTLVLDPVGGGANKNYRYLLSM
jgi:hypothetical protein